MKLNKESIKQTAFWKDYNYTLPKYDIDAVTKATHDAPVWLHFGAGNLLRSFPAVLAQRLLSAGKAQTGIICCDGYDEELIDRCYRACDNLSIVVTLHDNQTACKEVVASITESLKLSEDFARLEEIFAAPSLQMVSLSITENGYTFQDNTYTFLPAYAHDRDQGPTDCNSFFGKLTALSLSRCRKNLSPLALVSLDNCQDNGVLLERAVRYMAKGWLDKGYITKEEHEYLTKRNTYPLTMIDKITPHPEKEVAAILEKDGLEDMQPFMTEKNTYAAQFVNNEPIGYLLIEDNFPNGRPALQNCGVIFTDRKSVEDTAIVRTSACMNEMDTALGVYGILLGYKYISDEMKDKELVNLISRLSGDEAMPVINKQVILDPEKFRREVLTQRYPNAFLRDTPHRIVTDTSKKMAPRFGVLLQAYYDSMKPEHRATSLVYTPLTIAGWLRYLVGVDDEGNEFEFCPEPQLEQIRELIGTLPFGKEVKRDQLYPLLASRYYFGVNLFEVGVGETVVKMFNELNQGKGAVRQTLRKYCSD